MYEQTEYGLGYALIFAFLILGLLVVCIPRPRKKGFVDPAEAAKQKRMNQRQKAQAKAKKQSQDRQWNDALKHLQIRQPCKTHECQRHKPRRD